MRAPAWPRFWAASRVRRRERCRVERACRLPQPPMDPAEIRRIRGSRSRAAFGQLLGVTALTVLRWELPEDNKEARRPGAKMVEAMRRLASAPPETASGPKASPVALQPTAAPELAAASEAADGARTLDEARVRPLLEQLCTEQWRMAEDALTALLWSDSLTTRVGRTLASLGLVQVQVLAHMDLRGALAVLVPILNEAGRGELPDDVAGRAHVMAPSSSRHPIHASTTWGGSTCTPPVPSGYWPRMPTTCASCPPHRASPRSATSAPSHAARLPGTPHIPRSRSFAAVQDVGRRSCWAGRHGPWRCRSQRPARGSRARGCRGHGSLGPGDGHPQ
jgi:DNA-binding transcriptional regulator YiaG